MKKRFLGVAALFTLAASFSADAADIAAPVYTKALAPVPSAIGYDWTGIYVGGNFGYSVARNSASELKTIAFSGGLPFINSNEPFTLGPAGPLGGGQIGYNWQTAPHWMVGLEADWQWSGQKDSVCVQLCTLTSTTPSGLTVEQRLQWLATVRARLGYTQGGVLAYVTGGAAFGNVTEDIAETFTSFTSSVGLAHTAAGSFNQTKSGWVFGGGVETAIAGHWTAKLEYLYVDLGGTSDALPPMPFTQGSSGAVSQAVNTRIHDHIIRAGLNYRFGGSAADVGDGAASGSIYKAPPVAAAHYWTGLYVGGNVGYSIGHDQGSELFAAPVFTISSQTFTLSPAGALGGAQIGYNWQFAPHWMVGAEADWQWTGQTDAVCITTCTPTAAFPFALTAEHQVKSFATLRARFGYISDGWLWYVTGGATWGQLVENDSLVFSPNGASVRTLAGSFSRTATGWTLGTGVETALSGNWTAKLEYLYVDLGSTTNALPLAAADSISFFGGPGGAQSVTSTMRDHVVRLGVNYKFGDAGVVAKY